MQMNLFGRTIRQQLWRPSNRYSCDTIYGKRKEHKTDAHSVLPFMWKKAACRARTWTTDD